MKEQIFHVGVKALIRNKEGKFLITKERSYERWDLPGGRIGNGESIKETLARELKEELGIKVEMGGLRKACIARIKIKDQFGLLLLIYDCKLPSNVKLSSGSEYDEFRWVAKKELVKRLSNKFPNEFFKDL